MREILFKAKRLDNGEWESGRIIHSERNISGEVNECFICRGFADRADVVKISVDPKTVSQYTGLTDRNDNKIWENETRNIYSWGRNGDLIGVATIVWHTEEMGWCIEPSLGIEDRYDLRRAIENSLIHNPEILQSKK